MKPSTRTKAAEAHARVALALCEVAALPGHGRERRNAITALAEGHLAAAEAEAEKPRRKPGRKER